MKHSTPELLGVPMKVITAIEEHMTSREARKLYMAIINMRLNDTVDDYMSDLFKYRKKAIKHYEEKENELL